MLDQRLADPGSDSVSSAVRSEQRLKITEIFGSIQGESDLVGWPTVFVRLTGCPLRCRWCDTPYSFHGGQWQSFEDITAAVGEFGYRHVCVTGGEPLSQKRCADLLVKLCDLGYVVSLETSGAVDVSAVDSRVIKVVDFKAPGSDEVERNLWSILDHLGPSDQIKIVIADRADVDWALEQIRARELDRWQVLLSPVWQELEPARLAEWILETRAPVRLQLQIHKYLWGDRPGT